MYAGARAWWEETLSSGVPVGLPWITILGFVRICTNMRFLTLTATPGEAISCVRSWLSLPNVRILQPGDRHAEILFGLLEELGVAGNLTTGAHLAALAIEYHAVLVSSDTDFARFPGLRFHRLR